ncbi:PACE efflux transporter [Pseudohoeflea coraliihabitans]|uniref:PACE efflux transporter n=1 Tax=Pseudohoeflea coraliihabitans TaxID=2860393 RepID=A0ABS6WP83_9HYPH|nr:PACE efflux transporter [Pseudohoeflea sp. DP4N28-3]MBW3097774.1 PACE efflux transporter [Pseudohoeflea sp. DP4N28-3]
MRSVRDRIRHAISFELIGLLLVTPLGAWAFGTPLHDIGLVAVVSATIATGWNYLFNLGFDHALLRLRGSPRKSLALRIIHALMFEGGLLIVLLPFIAWYLGVSLMQALLMDVSFAAFYLVYTFIFNWVYDVLFPIPSAPRAPRMVKQAASSAGDQ